MPLVETSSDGYEVAGSCGDIAQNVWLTAPDVPLDFNGPTGRPFEPFTDWHCSLPIHITFRNVARRHADRVAVADGVVQFTYAQLNRAVACVADAIGSVDDADGAIGVLLPNSALFSVAALACLTTGRPYIPLDLRYPIDHNRQIISDSQLATLVVANEEDCVDYGLPATIALIQLNAVLESGDLPSEAAPGADIDLDAPAVILYTSGSTGRPKGIVNSQRALLQRVEQRVNSGHLSCDDTFLPLSSPCTIAGLREAITPLLVGGMLYALDPQTVGLREIRRVMRDARISVSWCVPALFRALMAIDQSTEDFAFLRIFRIGGEPILATDIQLLRRSLPPSCFIQIAYSSTETTGAQMFVPRDIRQESAVLPVGYMLPGASYAIRREDGSSALIGEIGELVIRSPYVALGEWVGGRVVPGAMYDDPSDPMQRIYPVGDLASIDATGLLSLAGRKDRQVKVRGVRIEPGELEVALRNFAGVSDAAVIVRTAGTTKSLVAFVTPSTSLSSVAARELVGELRAMIRSSLPGALWPSAIHVLAELPKLPGAKIDGMALRQLDQKLSASSPEPVLLAPSPPQDIHRTVVRSWRRVLGSRSLALRQTWEEAGGDSLKFLMFMFDLEEGLRRRVPIDIFDPTMSADDMAAAICASLAAPSALQGDVRDPIFVCPGVIGDDPALAAFRLEMGDAYRWVTVDYPDMVAMTGPSFSLDNVVAHVAKQIAAACPPGPIRLLGFSFGGILAYALARHLLAAGHEIGFLGIIDTNVSHGRAARDVRFEASRSRVHVRELGAFLRRENLLDNVLRVVAKELLRWNARYLLRRLAGRESIPVAPKIRYVIHSWATRYIRMTLAQRYLDDVGDDRLPLDLTLFRSAQVRPAAGPDLGWNSYVATVRVVDIPGDHETLWYNNNRPFLVTAVREVLGALEAIEGA